MMRTIPADRLPRAPYYQRRRHYKLRALALLIAIAGAAWGFWALVGKWM